MLLEWLRLPPVCVLRLSLLLPPPAFMTSSIDHPCNPEAAENMSNNSCGFCALVLDEAFEAFEAGVTGGDEAFDPAATSAAGLADTLGGLSSNSPRGRSRLSGRGGAVASARTVLRSGGIGEEGK
eukprot:3620587-Alexandrium_andersonii.AAC.1